MIFVEGVCVCVCSFCCSFVPRIRNSMNKALEGLAEEESKETEGGFGARYLSCGS